MVVLYVVLIVCGGDCVLWLLSVVVIVCGGEILGTRLLGINQSQN